MKAITITLEMMLILGATLVSGDVPTVITYQGLLTDDAGIPLNGDYSLTLTIYDAETGGHDLWSETQTAVSVNGGLFRVFLGSVNPITLCFDIPYWVEVQVGSESPQSPRIRLTPAPYSFMAMDIVPDAVTSSRIMDGEVKTADIENNAVTAAKITPDVVSSVDGVSNDAGNIDLVAGANITITPDNGANTITIAAAGGGGGDITGVTAGQGLTGGGTSGDVSLDVGAGTGIAVSADAVGLASNYASGSAYDSRFVNEGQNNSVTSAMIVDGTIQQGDLGFSAGDVTAVWSGYGLDGGGSQGDVTLSVENPFELSGSTHGVIRGTYTDGSHGWLGGISRGVFGQCAEGHWGALGRGEGQGVQGMHISGNSGSLGTSDNGVSGLNPGSGHWGALGTPDYGAYGDSDNGEYGFLGGTVGAFGSHPSGNFGALGSSSYGVYGFGVSAHAGYFYGDVYVTGDINKSACSFLIDHPLDPENKLLRHNCMESPEHLVVYRGTAQLDAVGEAIVEMPEYFTALAKENEATIHLTAQGRPFLTGYRWSPDHSSFTAYGDSNREVSWMVMAERDDPTIRQIARPVEEDKGPDSRFCDRGKLLHPTAYGYPETMRVDHDEGVGLEQRPAEHDRWSYESGGSERQLPETAARTRPMR